MSEHYGVYRAVFENSAVAITVVNADEKIVFWNRYAEKLYGCHDLGMRSIKTLYPLEEWKRLRKANIRKLGFNHHFETKAYGEKGKTVDIDLSIHVLKVKKKIIGAIGIATDVTERKKAKDEAEYERELLHTLMDNIPDSIYFKDIESRFITINKAKIRKLKLKSVEQAAGKTDFDFYPKQMAMSALEDERKIIKSKKPLLNKIEKIQMPGKTLRWVSATKAPIQDKNGKIVGIVGISRDITKQKLAEDELEQAKDQLEIRVKQRTKDLVKANKELANEIAIRRQEEKELRAALERQKELERIKTEFLSVTSHELRTPITPIRMQLQLMLKEGYGKINPKQKNSINLILSNLTRLNDLVEDILDMTKLQSGNLKFIFNKGNIGDIAKNVVENMRFIAKEQNIKIILKSSNVPGLVLDQDRIAQVFTNLINNAIKFTGRKGKIQVELRRFRNSVVVSISDNGIGMKKLDLATIFEPFKQLDSSMTREHGGTGLGLAIVKAIVKEHNGEIKVKSRFGKGSIFTFTIPLDLKVQKSQSKILK